MTGPLSSADPASTAPPCPAGALLLVLGMHRSGTSLAAHMLAALGADMADQPRPSPANAKGHWERPRINDLHDLILGDLGRSWPSATHALPLPAQWQDAPQIMPHLAMLRPMLQTLIRSHARPGIKDPRLSRLLPLWQGWLSNMRIAPRYILPLRPPMQVARSLAARDHLPLEQGIHRTCVYMADCIHHIGAAPVCVLPYAEWFTAPAATAARLVQFAQLPAGSAQIMAMAAAIPSAALSHDDPAIGAPPAIAQALHDAILAAQEHGQFSHKARQLAAQFREHEAMLAPLQTQAEIQRVSLQAQQRVIGDLNSLVQRLRQAQAA